MKKRIVSLIFAGLLIASIFSLSGCGQKSDFTVLTMYEGDYSEITLVHYMVKYLVEEYTDVKVDVKDQMAHTNMFKSLTAANPECDILLTYDGTVLGSWLKKDVGEVPEGTSLYEYTKNAFMEKYGAEMLGLLGINNTYAVAVTQSTAEKYQLKKVSDLVDIAPQLTFGAESSFFAQDFTDRYWPFVEAYGLKFKGYSSIDINLKYTAVANGNFDVTEVYTTDGLNRKYDLVILEDDLRFFPDYNGMLMVRKGLFEDYSETAPNLREVLDMLTGKLTNDSMTSMSYLVDVEERPVQEVARDFLIEQGLLK